MNSTLAQERLRAFGFNEIEAAIYCYLLQHAPVTGYRVSQGLGKAPANVYSALDGLSQKGAVVIDEGESRLCRATPPTELFNLLASRFNAERQAAEDALSDIYAPEVDHRIYQIKTVEHVFAHARSLIETAQSIILLDLFPEPFNKLKGDLLAAAERGVKLGLRAYDDETAIPGAVVSRHKQAKRHLETWPGQQLSVVADARRHICAIIDKSGQQVIQAVASDSLFLSCMHHNNIAADITAAHYSNASSSDPQIARISGLSLLNARPPGYEDFARATFGDLNACA